MKIYFIRNIFITTLRNFEFKGLVSIDIGFKTLGLTIINKKGCFKTLDIKPFNENLKISKLGIPEYITLSQRIIEIIKELMIKKPQLKNYCFSAEIPSIVSSFAPALSILLTTISLELIHIGIPIVFFTGNRLGGFYLKKRSYTKTEIKKLVKDNFGITYKISDHECDSLLAAYSIYLGVFGKYLNNVHLRPFELELQDITYKERSL